GPSSRRGSRSMTRWSARAMASTVPGLRAERDLRPVYLPPDPASRTTYEPGEIAQCDLWFPDADIPLGAGQNGRGQVPVITMVQGYSLVLVARLIPSTQAEDLFAGQWELIRRLGRVPKCLVWDGE